MASPEFILTRDLIASVETYIGWALKSEALPYTAGLVDIGDDGILETFLLFNRNLGPFLKKLEELESTPKLEELADQGARLKKHLESVTGRITPELMDLLRVSHSLPKNRAWFHSILRHAGFTDLPTLCIEVVDQKLTLEEAFIKAEEALLFLEVESPASRASDALVELETLKLMRTLTAPPQATGVATFG